MYKNIEIDLNNIKEFFKLNGYDWDCLVVDHSTGQIRPANSEDFVDVELPTLKFNDKVKNILIDEPYFALDLFVTVGKFELYSYRPGRHGEVDQQILYDDLSIEWQTYNSQMCK